MTSLQITVLTIWIVVGFGFVYFVGEAFGAGWDLILGLIATIMWYGGWASLIYFTFKAIFG
jgi:hypothetical protein